MGLFDFFKKTGAGRPDQITKEEIELLNSALGAAAGKEALLSSLKDFGRGTMGPNALMARMTQAADAKNNSEFAAIADTIQKTGKIPAANVAKCIEAVESRLLDLKEGDSERAKQTALLNKLKALK